MLNKYAPWQYCLLALMLLIGGLYALPNIYGEEPVLYIQSKSNKPSISKLRAKINQALTTANIPLRLRQESAKLLVLGFGSTEAQLQAKDVLAKELQENVNLSLNLASRAPNWFSYFGAKPMKLGLDLRGGIHFSMNVDVMTALDKHNNIIVQAAAKLLKANNLPQQVSQSSKAQFKFQFDNAAQLELAEKLLQASNLECEFIAVSPAELIVEFEPLQQKNFINSIMEQSVATLRRRVNELGVAEAIVQRQGSKRIIVELPGVQDSRRAKDILGKTASIEFHLQDEVGEQILAREQRVPLGSKIYNNAQGQAILLKQESLLNGADIAGAFSSLNSEGQAVVNIRLSQQDHQARNFIEKTAENIGRKMAVVYIENKLHGQGKDEHWQIEEQVISLAMIQTRLGEQFQITGLNLKESKDLALLLKSGTLPTTLSIVEERIIGPSIGADNIYQGLLSASIGLISVLVFMAIYYHVFGLIANVALLVNLILLLALMSIIGATLTLPGIAGIVLTLGMAVDANVLIFERIREERRLGQSPSNSIHRGFEYAKGTIIDSNLTTLIAGMVLFFVGEGPIKGFAVTLSLGILTSLITATIGTRALVNLVYGGDRPLRKIRIGI